MESGRGHGADSIIVDSRLRSRLDSAGFQKAFEASSTASPGEQLPAERLERLISQPRCQGQGEAPPLPSASATPSSTLTAADLAHSPGLGHWAGPAYLLPVDQQPERHRPTSPLGLVHVVHTYVRGLKEDDTPDIGTSRCTWTEPPRRIRR